MGNELGLYLLGGLKTAPLFMEGMRLALHERLKAAGEGVHSRLLLPYGDWSRQAVPQLWEIRRDMRRTPHRTARSTGGRRALLAIDEEERSSGVPAPGRRILIGHSGGGVAAVHAAQTLWEREGGQPCPVVLVGSPRIRIPERLRAATLYIHAEGRTPGRSADPVARIGSFGGWTVSDRSRLPVWRAGKFAPENAVSVPVIGGHADYFRDRTPFVDPQGRSNLDRLLEIVWPWLCSRLGLIPEST
ncbi:hypothetical protein [Cohnella zeiphila]|uniref:Alpha/beta hydrolase n=1 Tax=Cohnella zeiphila TaxID=2761120 RepID=A0A7X0SRY9_9BACL|nr:hypothetical protein [Cohnella zeiphila]MBB6735001.1 hypothetical protein [Cohnella zeiphila]